MTLALERGILTP